MAFLASLVLPFLVATLMAGATAVLWRAELARPLLFCTICFLVVLGLERLIHALVELVKSLWPLGGGYFIVARPTPDAIEMVERQITIENVAIALVAALLSYPLLVVVKNSMGK